MSTSRLGAILALLVVFAPALAIWFRPLASATPAALLFLALLGLIVRRDALLIRRQEFPLLLAVMALIAVNVSSAVHAGDISISGLKPAIQVTLIWALYRFCSIALDVNFFARFLGLLQVLVVPPVSLFLWTNTQADSGPEVERFANVKNGLAQMLLVIFFCNVLLGLDSSPVKLSSRKRSRYMTWLALLGLMASGSRGCQLSAIAFLALMWAYRYRSMFRARWVIASSSLLLGVPLVTIGYLNMASLSSFDVIQEHVKNTTGLNVYTGRQLIWPLVIGAIGQRPVFGWGPSAVASDFLAKAGIDANWSSHNLYLQIGLQTGSVGLFVLAFFFLALLRAGNHPRRPDVTRAAFALFTAIVFSEIFEVTLLQNNLLAGLGFWVALALLQRLAIAPAEKPA